jgi:hypothetical protein
LGAVFNPSASLYEFQTAQREDSYICKGFGFKFCGLVDFVILVLNSLDLVDDNRMVLHFEMVEQLN